MTEAEAKAIEHDEAEQIALAYIDKAFNNPEKPGQRIRHSIPANPREDTDLRLMAYIKQQRAAASRLLAVEAELGRVKAERAHMEEAAELLEWVALECRIEGTPEIHRAVGEWQSRNVARDHAAPSTPVAPEPAQDAGGVEMVTPAAAKAIAMVHVQNESARTALFGHLLQLESDRDAERTQKEAALLEVSRLSFELGKARGEADGLALLREGAEAETERLRMELEASERAIDNYRRQRDLFSSDARALRAENEGLKAKLKERDICWHCKDMLLEPDGRPHCESCPAEGDCDDAACSEDGCREERAQQPAEAAPVADVEPIDDEGVMVVAKAEAPSEPASFIEDKGPINESKASEPAGWVPGQRVRRVGRADLVGTITSLNRGLDGPNGYYMVRWDGGTSGCLHHSDLEPAPQPPAATGGADRPLTRFGLVAALREAYADERTRSFEGHVALAVLAEVLEKSR